MSVMALLVTLYVLCILVPINAGRLHLVGVANDIGAVGEITRGVVSGGRTARASSSVSARVGSYNAWGAR